MALYAAYLFVVILLLLHVSVYVQYVSHCQQWLIVICRPDMWFLFPSLQETVCVNWPFHKLFWEQTIQHPPLPSNPPCPLPGLECVTLCSWISLSIFQQNLNGYRTPPQWKLKKEGEHCIISEYELEINKTKSHVHFYSFLCFGDLSISHSRPGLPKYYSYHTACGLPCMCLIHSLL